MDLKKLNKKGIGALNMLIAGAITVLIAIITVSIGISVNENVKDSFANTTPGRTAAYNAAADGTTGLAGFSNYWVSIVSIIVLVVIVGLFAYFRGGAGVEVR